ncbi:MAG: MobA/MobL family protein [Holosporales bacterium]
MGLGNPHFHALVTRRPLINREFSLRKNTEIVSKPEHKITRKHLEVIANKHLALAGREEHIDCRSHKNRGSLFIAGADEGYYAQQRIRFTSC